MTENNAVRITRVFTSRLRLKDAVQLIQKLKIASSMRILVHGDNYYIDLFVQESHEDSARASTNFGDDVDPDDLPALDDCSETYVGSGVTYFKKQQPYSRKV